MSRLFSTSPLILGIIEDIEINLIRPFMYNYRSNVEDFDDLCYSIQQKGLLQPILVRNKEEHQFEIISGHRRYQACKKIGWRKIVCHIIELDDKDAFEVSLVENIQRKSLNPIEEAYAYKHYIMSSGWGGISELARRIGKSVSYIDKRVRLLDLPPDIIASVSNASMNPSTAEELLAVKDKKIQSVLSNLVQTNNLSSKDIRELIKGVSRDTIYDYGGGKDAVHKLTSKDVDERTHRSFNKAIIALKIAMSKLSAIIQETEENWIIYETLMQHRNMLHTQIDLLIKERMKI